MDFYDIYLNCEKIRSNIQKVIVGKDLEINLVLTALLSGGHILLEDTPGTGKTMLAKTLAKSLSGAFSRIQFTPDLLPSDLMGINFYNPKNGEFIFKRGSLFANIILADEINRATPRTQSGLLEAMEEKQITVDNESYKLSSPFFVIATQNPIETQGTFPLPEAQLDRFLMKLSLGYPCKSESIQILKRFMNEYPEQNIQPVLSTETLLEMQERVKNIFIHEDLLSYIVDITEATRIHEAVSLGVSVRGSLALMKAAQAYACIHNSEFVTPDHIKTIAPFIFGHRIIIRGGIRSQSKKSYEIVNEIIENIKVPTEDFKKSKVM